LALQNYIAENLSIDKDSRILLCRNLLINLDELSTLSKVEINSLKSLFSKDKINERLPYDRRNSILPRRCSFIGSTNQVEFLNDETGSVRWLCFIIDEIDWSYSNKVNIDMVYSQAYHLFKNGFEYNLTQEEVKENDEYNKQFQIVTSEKELINKFLRPGTKDNHELFWTATDILLYLAHITENKVKLSPVILGKALKMNGFERVKPTIEQVYGYYIIRK
jgi:predicted P-loop ATPase